MKKSNDSFSQLQTHFIEAFSSLLALKWNKRNKLRIKNHAADRVIFPTSYGVCPQISIFYISKKRH